jgi:hypothetical protein
MLWKKLVAAWETLPAKCGAHFLLLPRTAYHVECIVLGLMPLWMEQPYNNFGVVVLPDLDQYVSQCIVVCPPMYIEDSKKYAPYVLSCYLCFINIA